MPAASGDGSAAQPDRDRYKRLLACVRPDLTILVSAPAVDVTGHRASAGMVVASRDCGKGYATGVNRVGSVLLIRTRTVAESAIPGRAPAVGVACSGDRASMVVPGRNRDELQAARHGCRRIAIRRRAVPQVAEIVGSPTVRRAIGGKTARMLGTG